MKRFISALILCVALAGCQSGDVAKFTRAVTTTINNPIGDVDIYRVDNTYAASLELFAEYRRYCWSAPYKTLMADPVASKVCGSRRPVVRALWGAQAKAKAAIITAKKFVANNPTLNAASAIGAAWQAVTDFQSAIPAK